MLVACAGAPAGPSRDALAPVTSVHVAGQIHLLQGPTWNALARIGTEETLLVDTALASDHASLRAALERLEAAPVRVVINTHYHADHTGGNAAFADAIRVAQHNVRTRLQRGGVGGNYGADRYEFAATVNGLPELCFEHELVLFSGGEEVRVIHFPQSHTDGDSIVYFPESNLVGLGDLFVTYGFPSVDLMNGGSVSGMIATLDAISAMLPDDVLVVPGHGAVASMHDVRRFADMLRETSAAVDAGIAEGKSLQALQRAAVLAPWQEWAGYFSVEQFTETLYNDRLPPEQDVTGSNTAPDE
jgi:cyclase